jgi:hypothetical protein
MKDQAQARLAEETAKYGPVEQERRIDNDLAKSDDMVAQKWRRLMRLDVPKPPPVYKGSFLLTDDRIDKAKREGRE